MDFSGYGYIGINAKNVKVGEDASSAESKNLRKAFATLCAVYRTEMISSYYAELAQVIQYPISNTSWAAPKETDSGYSEAFTKDVTGQEIYSDTMTTEQKYEAALTAATGYFSAAGYTWDAATGTFTAAP